MPGYFEGDDGVLYEEDDLVAWARCKCGQTFPGPKTVVEMDAVLDAHDAATHPEVANAMPDEDPWPAHYEMVPGRARLN